MANLLTKALSIGGPDAKLRERVMGRVKESQRTFGGQNTIFRELNRYFLGLSPPEHSGDNDQPLRVRDDPNLFVPKSLEVIASAVPQWLFSQFGRRPYLKVLGRTEDDHKRKDAVTSMLDYDITESRLAMQAIPYGYSLFKYGTGIGKVTYRYEQFKTTERVSRTVPVGYDENRMLITEEQLEEQATTVVDYDGPWFDWVSIFNFGVDWLYYELDQMRFVWERRWTDRETLDHENEMYRALKGKDLYKNLDKIPEMPKGYAEEIYQTETDDDVGEMMGWWGRPGATVGQYARLSQVEQQRDRAIEIIEYWDRLKDERVFIANGETPILNGPNPYWDKKFPYVATTCIDLEGHFWGMSYLHVIKQLQEELNAHRNLMLKQAHQNITNVWAVDESVDLPEQGIEIGAGDVIQMPFFASGKPPLVPLLQGRPIPPEGYAIENMILGDMEKAVASSSLRTGGGSAKGIDTATEAKLVASGEERRIQLVSFKTELTFMQQVGLKYLSRRQQYFKKEQVFRIIGEEAVDYKRLSPQDIAGNFDFEPVGQQTFVSPEVLRQQILQSIALTQNPMVAKVSNVYEQVKEFWAQSNFKWPDRFVVPPPQKTENPHKENIVMAAGEWEDVIPSEDHPWHIQVHREGLAEARDFQAIRQFEEHIAEHERYLPKGGGSSPQEQPGLRGYAGNVPNPGNQGPENPGGIAARVNAGPGV